MELKEKLAKIEKIVEQTHWAQKFPDKFKETFGISKRKVGKLIRENKMILSEFIGNDGIRQVEGYVIRKDRLGTIFIYTMDSWVKAQEGYKKFGKKR